MPLMSCPKVKNTGPLINPDISSKVGREGREAALGSKGLSLEKKKKEKVRGLLSGQDSGAIGPNVSPSTPN